MVPPLDAAPSPKPCDDFRPTNLTGSSWPNGNGPALRTDDAIENNLEMVMYEIPSLYPDENFFS